MILKTHWYPGYNPMPTGIETDIHSANRAGCGGGGGRGAGGGSVCEEHL